MPQLPDSNRRSDFHVVGIDFRTREFSSWQPDDPADCEVWATANVGDDTAAAYFDVHICTRQAIGRLDDKRHCFAIDEFRGVDDLVAQLDAFIANRVPSHLPGDPYHVLARYWLWEYEY